MRIYFEAPDRSIVKACIFLGSSAMMIVTADSCGHNEPPGLNFVETAPSQSCRPPTVAERQ